MINTEMRDTQRKMLKSSSAYIAALYVVVIICSSRNAANLRERCSCLSISMQVGLMRAQQQQQQPSGSAPLIMVNMCIAANSAAPLLLNSSPGNNTAKLK